MSLKYDFGKQIVERKLAQLEIMKNIEATINKNQDFWENLRSHFITEDLFDEKAPWKITPSENMNCITFKIDRKIGPIDMQEDMLMACIEKIQSSFRSRFNNTWKMTSQESWMIQYRAHVEVNDTMFSVYIEYFGDNPTCELKTREVWKKVNETYVDCGMEREDEPAPFEGLDGKPVG